MWVKSQSGLLTPLSILGCVAGIGALAIAEVRIEPPAWRTETQAVVPGPESLAEQAPLGRVARDPTGSCAIKEMADTGHLAQALTDAKQLVSFNARTLIDAGVADEVAEGMVGVMRVVAEGYDVFVAQNDKTSARYSYELLLAVWPDMGSLIRDGKLKLDIEAVPEKNWDRPRAPIVVNYNKGTRVLDYKMSLRRWSVAFAFTESSNPQPSIFSEIVANTILK